MSFERLAFFRHLLEKKTVGNCRSWMETSEVKGSMFCDERGFREFFLECVKSRSMSLSGTCYTRGILPKDFIVNESKCSPKLTMLVELFFRHIKDVDNWKDYAAVFEKRPNTVDYIH